jgi:hypothetical protein
VTHNSIRFDGLHFENCNTLSLVREGKNKNNLLERWNQMLGQSRRSTDRGSLEKEANHSTTTKKETVPTSCRFEKPAASPKDFFCWLTLTICGQMFDRVQTCL